MRRAGAAPTSPASRTTIRYTTSFARLGSDLDTWGYGVIGGVTFNLPMLWAGTKLALQGAYAHGAIGYSGATAGMGRA